MNYDFNPKQLETFTAVNQACTELATCLDPSVFVLQPRAQDLIKRIQDLQTNCEHIFVEGKCIVCGASEKAGEASAE